MSSVIKQAGSKAKQVLTRRAWQRMNEVKPKVAGKTTIALIKPNMPKKEPPLSEALKNAIKKEFYNLKEVQAKITPNNAYEVLDASLEGFFLNREYNLQNFNLLIKMLASRGQIDEALGILEKMKIMGITPNRNTYIQLLVCSGRARDTDTAEVVFDKAVEALGNPDGVLYTTLISTYANSANPIKVEALINEKKAKGYKVTAADWTNYMRALDKAGRSHEAVEVYKKRQTEVVIDEYMMSTAIRACGKSNEAEYAKRLWTEMQSLGFQNIAYHYNAIIYALGKRRDYAEEALDIYRQMKGLRIQIDDDTIMSVLIATSRLGDLVSAQHALIDMKDAGIEMNDGYYQFLLKTYAEACINATENAKDIFIRESWELFRQCEEKGMVKQVVVDALLEVHCKAYREHQAEDMVLPIYDEYGFKKGKETYRSLMSMYTLLNEPKIVFRLWDTFLTEKIKPDMYILNSYLENTLKTGDTDRAVECLEAFKENNLRPLYVLIKKIHFMEEKPLRLWAAIQEFPYFYTDFHNKEYGKLLRIDKVEQRFTA